MGIWQLLSGNIVGGWKTHGPNAIAGPGAFDSGSASEREYESVNTEAAMKLTAVWACMHIRAETIGTLPLHLRDGNKKILRTHPLYNILHRSPNANQTAAEFWSMQTAHVDMHGNAVNVIERGAGGKVIALTPMDPTNAKFEFNKAGTRKKWFFGGSREEISDNDVLHFSGFSMGGGWGAPRIDIGRQVLGAQLAANSSALRAFKQGLKVGGFFLNEGQRELTNEQLKDFQQRLETFGRPENIGKWMTLLRGFKPIAGTEFAVKPADAQLLESRAFGIEEICRLFNTPPPLIGHTSKASSWASSLEHLNLHFITYSLAPTLIRFEQRIEKKLLTPYDIADGIEAKYSLQGLLRGDSKSRMSFYAQGLQNGVLCQDEVRSLEDMPDLPNGEGKVYRVQLNMAGADEGDDKPNNNPEGNNK